MSLKNLDLNLLKTLEALIAERSVTRAGQALGRSQPAVSNALHRLREALGDELFTRGPDGLALTPRAEALRQPLKEALKLLEVSLFADAPFDPFTATGIYRISTPDRLSIAVVPRLFDRLRALAPKMQLHVATADRDQALELLDSDEIDLALGWLDDKPSHLKAEALLDEHLYCVVRRDHPILKMRSSFNVAAILSFPHVVVSATGGRTAIFDEFLASSDLRRHALVSVSNFTAVPHLLARSDMIGIFTKLASEVFETSFGLAKRRVPLEIPQVTTKMVWHARNNDDRRNLWLRQQIKDVYASLCSVSVARACDLIIPPR